MKAKMAAFMCLRSDNGIDEYYVDMAINSILPFVQGIYVQDQRSTDRAVDVARRETVGNQVPLCIDVVDTGTTRFGRSYNEPYYRTLAIERCEAVFRPDWVLQIDADDLFTPYFFEKVSELEASGELARYKSIRHASERFITPAYRTRSSHALQVINEPYYPPGNGPLTVYDPHTRLWRAGLGIGYGKNPHMDGFLHCVLTPDPRPVIWIKGICNIHLHRTFGPKAVAFWKEGGDVFEFKTPFNPATQAPKWFYSEINIKDAEYTPYEWEKSILTKWRIWGQYDPEWLPKAGDANYAF